MAKNALCKTEGFQRTRTNRRQPIVREFCDPEVDGPQDDEPDPFKENHSEEMKVIDEEEEGKQG